VGKTLDGSIQHHTCIGFVVLPGAKILLNYSMGLSDFPSVCFTFFPRFIPRTRLSSSLWPIGRMPQNLRLTKADEGSENAASDA
jgi:hypothetical protein